MVFTDSYSDAVEEVHQGIQFHLDRATMPESMEGNKHRIKELVAGLDDIEDRYDGDYWEQLVRIAVECIVGAAVLDSMLGGR